MSSACAICGATVVAMRSSPGVALWRCRTCATLWAEHEPAPPRGEAEIGSSGVWNSTLSPPSFIAALELRRLTERIVSDVASKCRGVALT